MDVAGSSQSTDEAKRKRALPEQLVPPLSQCVGSGACHDDEVLNAQIEQDYFVSGWMQKVFPSRPNPANLSGEKVIAPTITFEGRDPDYGNPYRPSFFLPSMCYQTANLRIRRSVFRPPNSTDVHHYIYCVRLTGKSQHEIVRFSLDDIDGMITAFQGIRKEIAAYK